MKEMSEGVSGHRGLLVLSYSWVHTEPKSGSRMTWSERLPSPHSQIHPFIPHSQDAPYGPRILL